MGPFFADFCSHAAKLIVEADGGQHGANLADDAARSRFLEGEGYRVIRFWNNDILENIDGVVETVAKNLAASFASKEAAARGIGEERRS